MESNAPLGHWNAAATHVGRFLLVHVQGGALEQHPDRLLSVSSEAKLEERVAPPILPLRDAEAQLLVQLFVLRRIDYAICLKTVCTAAACASKF